MIKKEYEENYVGNWEDDQTQPYPWSWTEDAEEGKDPSSKES